MPDKRTVASALREIASLLEIEGANPFKTRAFENAARALEGLDGDLHQTVESGELSDTPGIGKATAAIITDLVLHGDSDYLEELRSKYPSGLLDVLRIPGLSAKKVGVLHGKLGVDGLDALEAACRDGRVARLGGFGEKSSQKILSGIVFVRRSGARFLLPKGLEVAAELETLLGRHPLVSSLAVSGEVRRRLEVVNGVEICLATPDPDALAEAIESLAPLSGVEKEGELIRGRWATGIPVTFWIVDHTTFPLRLFLSTGSGDYVSWALEKDASPRRAGPVDDERALFDALGVPWLEPELREKETERFWTEPPAILVRQEDLRGIFHVHSTWSDGVDPLEDMLTGARNRGYSYVGISDHSKSAGYAGGLSDERVRQQRAEIRKLRTKFPGLTIFHGTEADILADGSIDYEPSLLAELDFVIASVHSRFGMSVDEMTERLVRALSNPFVTFLGHMTGRMLLTREGYSFDLDAVFEAAAAHGVMIEINGNPNRRDIDWRLLRRALDRGVGFSIHPDAHAVRALDNTVPGVWNARKAGLGPDQIFNTRPVEEVAEVLAARRTRAIDSA
jgi:DNA polymerase (family 10)